MTAPPPPKRMLAWARPYPTAALRGDLAAGVTTAVVLVPQALAYAMLAGVPARAGLVAAAVAPLAYALWGRARELAVGPVAIDALIVAAAVGPLAAGDPTRAAALAAMLALLVGAAGLLLGLTGGAFLSNFLSRPVVAGFAAGAAVLIGFSQIGPLLGLANLPRGLDVLTALPGALANLGPLAPALGLGALAVLLVGKRLWPRLPWPLVVVAGGLGLSVALDLAAANVAVVGAVGGAAPTLGTWAWGDAAALAPAAVLLSFVGFVEAHAVTRRFAQARGEDTDPGHEWTALGLANVAAGSVGGMPVTGGLSRTAVNHAAGARTPAAAALSGLLAGAVLVGFADALAPLPVPVLAAIIVAALPGLVDVAEARRLRHVKCSDFVLLVGTAVATVAAGPLWGLAAGIAASVLWFVVRTTRPHAAVLGQLPGTNIYRNVRNYPLARSFAGVLIARIDAQFYFGNISFLKAWLRDREAELDSPLRAVVLEAASINQLDASADRALAEIAADYAERGIELRLANVKMPVFHVMERSGLADAIGRDRFYLDLPTAVAATLERLAPDVPYRI